MKNESPSANTRNILIKLTSGYPKGDPKTTATELQGTDPKSGPNEE